MIISYVVPVMRVMHLWSVCFSKWGFLLSCRVLCSLWCSSLWILIASCLVYTSGFSTTASSAAKRRVQAHFLLSVMVTCLSIPARSGGMLSLALTHLLCIVAVVLCGLAGWIWGKEQYLVSGCLKLSKCCRVKFTRVSQRIRISPLSFLIITLFR